MTKPPCAIVVDATSSGRYLPPEFRRLGLDVLHVTDCEHPNADDIAAFDTSSFTALYDFIGNADALADQIAHEWTPVAVIAGSDVGVSLADRLAARFQLRGNNPATSARRLHKYEMIEAVSAHAMTARQHMTSDLDDALCWVAAQNSWPIVAKPVASTGSEDVVYCDDAKAIERMLHRIVGKRNLNGTVNDEVLLQTYLEGPQYVVNAVSRDGHHHVTDVWSIRQRQVEGGAHITDHKWSLRPEEPLVRSLVAYAAVVLSACGFTNGPSHTELRLTPDGPAVIETSARLMGATLEPDPFIRAFGVSQARLAVENCLNLRTFENARRRGYEVRDNIAIFHLNIPESGVIRGIPGAAYIRELPSFHATSGLPKIGSEIIATSVNIARAGYIYLLHPDFGRLMADVTAVDEICQSGQLFDLDSQIRRSHFSNHA